MVGSVRWPIRGFFHFWAWVLTIPHALVYFCPGTLLATSALQQISR